jgi:hypothetical protein
MKPTEEFTGVWWFPDNPEERMAGVLTFDSSQGGLLELRPSRPPLRKTDIYESYDVIHGRLSNGKEATLASCQDCGQARGFGSGRPAEDAVVTWRIHGNVVFLGLHLPAYKQNNIRSLTTSFRYLYRWMDTAGVSLSHGEKFQDLDLCYREPEPIILSFLPDFEMALGTRLSNIPASPDWDGETTIIEEAYVSIRTPDPRSYNYYYEIVKCLQDFFTIASLRYCPPHNIRVEGGFRPNKLGDGTVIYPNADVLFMDFLSDSKERAPHPLEFLFRLSDVTKELGQYLGNWFGKKDLLYHLRVLYLSSRYTRQSFVESQFLTIVQAVEVYHRRFFDGMYLPKSWFEEKILPVLVNALPKEIDIAYKENCAPQDLRSFCDTARSSLKWLNEYSLLRRLKVLTREFADVITPFVPDPMRTIKEVSDARNYLTHWTEQDTKAAKSPERLAVLVYFLQLIIEIGFLREMGFKTDVISKIIHRNLIYKWRFDPVVWQKTNAAP